MAEDMDTDINPAAGDGAADSSADEQALDEDLRKLALVVIACVCAIALFELLRWRLKRAEESVAAHHPLLTELGEELVDRPWRFH